MNQPDIEFEKELNDIDSDKHTIVPIPRTNESVNVGWMKPYTTEKFTRVLVDSDAKLKASSEQDVMEQMSKKSKILSQIASYIILNNFFKINFFHKIYWRYLYYWKEYTYEQLLPIVLEGKKKIPAAEYALAIGLAGTMKETVMTMTTKEVESFRLELMSAQELHSAKNTQKP